MHPIAERHLYVLFWFLEVPPVKQHASLWIGCLTIDTDLRGNLFAICAWTASAHEELFQAKQGVSGTPHGTKPLKCKCVRRANSCGNSTAFENGSKRLFDKSADGRRKSCVNRLQEEVEALRQRLAEEEEEARKLRNEVSYDLEFHAE